MRCLFFDCPVTVGLASPPTLETLAAALKAVGGNTGNILFRYGIASSVQDDLIPCHWSEGRQLALETHFDAVVLGAANWLSVYHDNGNDKRARILRLLNKPTICIGLGVQSAERTCKKLDFPPASLDFLATLQELDATVLVRDEFTFDQCVHHGLTNVAIIGFPSNFIDLTSDSADALRTKSVSDHLLSVVSLNHGYIRKDISHHDASLLSSVRQSGGIYIVQDNLNGEIEAALSPLKDASKSLLHRILPHSISPLLSPKVAIERNLFMAGTKLRVYFNALEWMQELRGSSLVLGTRIHGSIAALQAGVPSAITTIDSRTEGLAETLGIPRVKIERLDLLKKTVTPGRVIDLAGLDFAAYRRRRTQLLSVYKQALSCFGLTLSPRLSDCDC